LAILRDRLRGWPRTDAPFKLRKWGLIINLIGLAYGGAMLVNFAWPRIQSNPQPKQEVVAGSQLLNFHIGFLNDIPILWTVFIFILVVGALYYLITGRNKEFAPVTAPEGEPLPAAEGAA